MNSANRLLYLGKAFFHLEWRSKESILREMGHLHNWILLNFSSKVSYHDKYYKKWGFSV